MGLFDWFRTGRSAVKVVQAVREHRRAEQAHGDELLALPMPDLVVRTLASLHHPAMPSSRGRLRPARPDADARATALDLPADARDFYACCDGIESDDPDFALPIASLDTVRRGDARTPSLTTQLHTWWKRHGNDSAKKGMLAVFAPDDLVALATDDAQTHVQPDVLDRAVALVERGEAWFTVLLLTDETDMLRRGNVLEVENGIATRYDTMKTWLAAVTAMHAGLRTLFTQADPRAG